MMHDAPLDIEANRRAAKWTRRQLLIRTLWTLATPLFRFSPRIFWGWRNMLLRLFGARIGQGVHIYPSVRIVIPWTLRIDDQAAVGDGAILYGLGEIHIGRAATISQHAHLCAGTHDYTRADFPLLKPPIRIGSGVWICADAFVGPGVEVGDFAIVAACAVVIKNVAPWTIVGGNPARLLRERPPFQQSGDAA